MSSTPGIREQTRARVTAQIHEAAQRQLAEVGAAGLSLRSIAREIGMVSSAVYRYVESRDDLLTQLIIEAYSQLGDAAEVAVDASIGRSDIDRWVAVAAAIRRWAVANPHKFLLLYGSPVPGYAAPEATVEPAIRPTIALLSVLREARQAGRLASPDGPQLPLDPTLRLELEHTAATLGFSTAATTETDAGAGTLLAGVVAWTQLFGLVSFELTNQTRGLVSDHEQLFLATARFSAHAIGLR